MKKLLLKSASITGILLFTGCSFNYKLTTNVPNAKVYCGYNKENMKFCYTTPFIRKDSPSLSWSRKYFQAHKEGYQSSPIFQQPNSNNDISIHLNLIKNKQSISKPKLNKHKEIVNSLMKENNLQSLKEYTDKNPNSVYYITDNKLRLILTGPQGMKVGDIKKLITKGRSETIIIALIQRVKTPYKEFTLEEIDILSEMKLSDNIIASMINVTTELLKNEEKKKQQQFYLKEQKKISNQKTQVIYQNTQNSSQPSHNKNPTGNKVQDEIINRGVGMLLDKLF